MEKKYYWLKLKRDFFKRHDIRIIEAMPNGKDYILFYLKLLCESVDHEGKLRFSESVPYNAEMLSIITDTNQDTVQAAVKLFLDLGMMEKLDDGTLYMAECQRMIGCETAWAEKKRQYREKLALEAPKEGQPEDIVLPLSDKSKSKSKRKSKNDNTSEYDAEFEEVWSKYPRKERRADALKAYLAARKSGTDKDTILAGIARYKAYIAAERIEPRYIAQGGTWFNQKRWMDEYATSKNYTEREIDESKYEGVYE
jgi:predicted phage replisome organizer